MNSCFEFIRSADTPIAIKAFSLSILGHLATEYPDIRGELKLLIEDMWEHATPAIRSRAKRILKVI
jgi:hypothetical protein